MTETVEKKKNPTTKPPNLGKNSKSSSNQYHCNYCQKDISRLLIVRCVECTNFDLCLECFSNGVEIASHLKTHAYRISDALLFPLVEEDWTAREELLLLEGIEMFGLGNWKDVSDHIQSINKTDKKCEQHYIQFYLNSPNGMPNFLPHNKEGTSIIEKSELSSTTTITMEKKNKKQANNNAAAGGSFNTSSNAVLPGADIAGYMPLRGDFDVEYDNDAELILADMTFAEDDHPTERELKVKVIDIYNRKLDERKRRKEFVLERNLLDYKKHQAYERRRPKEEREIYATMRPFARFHSAEEHENLISGLIRAKRLAKRIEELKHYRQQGIRTLKEAEEYNQFQKKKQAAEPTGQTQNNNSVGNSVTNRRSSLSRGNSSSNLELTANNYIESKRMGTSTSPSSSIHSSIDISDAPGANLLTVNEKELCARLHLLPKHYMVIKDSIIRESFRVGYLDKGVAEKMIKIDVRKTGEIFDFFVSCGWVKKQTTVGKTNPVVPIANSTNSTVHFVRNTDQNNDLHPGSIKANASENRMQGICSPSIEEVEKVNHNHASGKSSGDAMRSEAVVTNVSVFNEENIVEKSSQSQKRSRDEENIVGSEKKEKKQAVNLPSSTPPSLEKPK